MGVGQKPDDLAKGRARADFLGTDFESAELVHCPGKDGVVFTFIDRHALAGQDGLIDGGTAPNHRAVDADSLAGADNNNISDRQVLRWDLDLGVTSEYSRGPRVDVEKRPYRSLRSLECQRFQALAQECDEDHFCRDEVLTQTGGRHAGDRQGDVGADRAREERSQSQINNAPAANQRGDQGQRHAEWPLPGALQGPEHDVSTQQRSDHDRQHHQGPALGIRVVVMVVMSRSVPVPVVVMGWN
jgi:hypothetical protein